MTEQQQPAGEAAGVIQAFEQMPAVLWAFEGPQHRVVAANRAARASIGDRAGIIGRPIREVIPEMAGQQIFEMIDQVYASGQPVSHADRRVLVDRDGDGHLEEDFYTYTFLPTRDGDGAVTGMVVHIVETTRWVRQRQAAEARADDSERRYQQARDVVLSLQRSLLPHGVPVLPRMRLAARYSVAGAEAAAGGDWFDAVALPDGRVALLVGDVTGHGPEAAAVMGQLRAVALQALIDGAGVLDVLGRLDTIAGHIAAAEGATVGIVLVDTHTGTLEYASRAHPSPLVLGPGGAARFLPGAAAGPLGVGSKPARLHVDRLHPGEFVVLYSDGLIERAGRGLDAGRAELATVAAAILSEPVSPHTSLPALAVDRLCGLLIERFAWAGYQDDVTVLAAELLADQPPPPRLRLPARPDSLAVARAAINTWLAGLGVSPSQVGAVQHALGEALGNAVEHAYGGGPGDFAVTVDLDEQGVLRSTVTDRGRWRPVPADPQYRGRGMLMMRALSDHVEVVTGERGTTVTLTHRLRRPVEVGAATTRFEAAGEAAEQAREVPFRIETGGPALRVAGAIDAATVDQLERAVRQAGRGGVVPVTLDLTEVTLLSSVGVRLLHRLDAAAVPAGLRLTAPAGGAVHQVLTLTGLADLLA
ncbi:SpoIIE family protein phosphatase [Actinoplanes sp. KI2]|uniref:SpoIIE family protein phosphatase n=1 Tax=Actinoplanes sp. KI2 TaxID=2983315 RepID=UPI0021D5992A|nr:SpoIIE family protein phosphatase [Actinoplanes sp. KI2]MCU7728910.1 SpoIIE family protein phosphatase [Actinoplanes sp. KI2]